MATLPALKTGLDLVGKVAPQSGGVPQVPSTSFGSDLFRAQDEFGKAFGSALDAFSKKATASEAQELANELNKYSLDLTSGMGPNGDGSVKEGAEPGSTGFSYLKGKDAMGQVGAYESLLQQKKDDVLGRASSAEVRRLLEPTLTSSYMSTVNAMRNHAHSQQKEWMAQVDKDTLGLAGQVAVNGALAWVPGSAATEAPISAAIADVAAKSREIAQRKLGNDPNSATLVDAEVENAVTQAHMDVMKGLQSQDPSRAEAWFAKHQGDMNPAMVTEYREQLTSLTRISRAQTFADQFNQADLATAAGQTRAYDMARKNLSGKEEEAARQELDVRIGQATRARELRVTEGTKEVYSMIHAGKTPDEIFRVKPDLLGVVSQNQYGLKSVYDAYAAVSTGKAFAPVSDGSTIHDLLAKGPDLANVELLPLKTKMTVQEWDKANTAKSHYLAELQGDKGVSHLETYLKEVAPSTMNFDKDKASDVQRYQANMARSEMGVWFEQYKKDHNKFPSDQEKRDQALRLMIKVKADPSNTGALGIFPKEGEKSFEGNYAFQAKAMSPQQRDAARVVKSDIPQALMLKVDEAIKLKGLPPTDDLREQLAGAIVTKNMDRYHRLLGVK